MRSHSSLLHNKIGASDDVLQNLSFINSTFGFSAPIWNLVVCLEYLQVFFCRVIEYESGMIGIFF